VNEVCIVPETIRTSPVSRGIRALAFRFWLAICPVKFYKCCRRRELLVRGVIFLFSVDEDCGLLLQED